MANAIDLAGRVAIVTGGAQGIGRAIAERLLTSGASVTIWDRHSDLAHRTAAELAKFGEASCAAVDVTRIEDVEAARDGAIAASGRIDILVNNAGIAGPNAVTWGYPVAAWDDVIRVNLTGTFNCCRAVVPSMIARNYGRIVNIASIAGKEGNPNAS